MDFDDDAITERIRQMAADGEIQPTVTKAGGYDYLTGALQNALAMGTSYVSRRIDIDLQQRLAGSQPSASVRPSTQNVVADHADVTTRAVASAGGIRLGDMLPWLAAAGIAWFFFGPKRA